MKVELNRKYETRDGQSVQILKTNYRGTEGEDYPILGIVTDKGGFESVSTWTADGFNSASKQVRKLDLIDVTERVARYFMVYGDGSKTETYFTEDGCENSSVEPGRIAMVEMLVTPGVTPKFRIVKEYKE